MFKFIKYQTGGNTTCSDKDCVFSDDNNILHYDDNNCNDECKCVSNKNEINNKNCLIDNDTYNEMEDKDSNLKYEFLKFKNLKFLNFVVYYYAKKFMYNELVPLILSKHGINKEKYCYYRHIWSKVSASNSESGKDIFVDKLDSNKQTKCKRMKVEFSANNSNAIPYNLCRYSNDTNHNCNNTDIGLTFIITDDHVLSCVINKQCKKITIIDPNIEYSYGKEIHKNIYASVINLFNSTLYIKEHSDSNTQNKLFFDDPSIIIAIGNDNNYKLLEPTYYIEKDTVLFQKGYNNSTCQTWALYINTLLILNKDKPLKKILQSQITSSFDCLTHFLFYMYHISISNKLLEYDDITNMANNMTPSEFFYSIVSNESVTKKIIKNWYNCYNNNYLNALFLLISSHKIQLNISVDTIKEIKSFIQEYRKYHESWGTILLSTLSHYKFSKSMNFVINILNINTVLKLLNEVTDEKFNAKLYVDEINKKRMNIYKITDGLDEAVLSLANSFYKLQQELLNKNRNKVIQLTTEHKEQLNKLIIKIISEFNKMLYNDPYNVLLQNKFVLLRNIYNDLQQIIKEFNINTEDFSNKLNTIIEKYHGNKIEYDEIYGLIM